MKNKNISTFIIEGTELFARLALLNLLWILFSLPLVTILPATYSLFSILKRWEEPNQLKTSLFSNFKNQFFIHFKKSFKNGFSFVGIGGFFMFNLFFFRFYSHSNKLLLIIKYANVFLFLLFMVIFLFSFSSLQYKDMNIKTNIITAFLLMFLYPKKTLMALSFIVLLYTLFLIYPAFIFFFSLSVPAYLFSKITKIGVDSRLFEKLSITVERTEG